MNTHNTRITGVIYALAAVALWATLGIGFKTAVTRMGNFDVTFHLGWLATGCLFLYLMARGKAGRIMGEFRRQPLFFILAGILGLGLQQILYLTAFSLQAAAQVVILYYLYPLIMVLLSAVIFRESISRVAIACLVVSFLGVAAFLTQGQLGRLYFGTGDLLVILAAVCWAGFSVWIKHRSFDIEIGMFLFCFFGMLFLAALIPAYGLRWHAALPQAGLLIYLAIFPTAAAFVLWNKALRLAPTRLCAQIALMTPVISTILIVLLLGEKIGFWHIVGLVCIVGATWLNLRLAPGGGKGSNQ